MAIDNSAAVDTFEWIRSGSLLAFAGAVLWELRQQRTERNQQNKIAQALLVDLNSAIAILLDRSGLKVRKQTNPLGPDGLPVMQGDDS